MSAYSSTTRAKRINLVWDGNNSRVPIHPNDDESSLLDDADAEEFPKFDEYGVPIPQTTTNHLSDDAAASQIPKFDVTRLECKCLEYYALLRADKSNK